MSANLSRIRRLLPFGVVPWNPDDEELQQQPAPRPRRELVDLLYDKTHSGFDIIEGLNRREGESPRDAMRTVDLGNAMAQLPPVDDGSGLVMAKPTDDGRYAERIVSPGGRIAGFGDQRDYAPLAESTVSRPAFPAAVAADTAPLYDPTANLVADLGTPPVMIRRNNKRRPLGAIGGDSDLDRDTALLEAQQGYKAPRSTKDLLVRLATGFFNGGIGGAAANALDYSLNQDTRNADAVGYDMGQTAGRIRRNQQEQATVAAQRRQGLQDRLLESQIAENTAQASRQPTVRGEWSPVDTDNDGVPDSEEYIAPAIGMTRRPFPKAEREPAGFTLAPGGARYDAKGNVIVERPAPPKDDSNNNDTIQTSIEDAKRERDGIWTALKTIPSTVERISPYGDKEQVPNPEYVRLMSRGQKLDDDIRGWTQKLKPGRTRTAGSGGNRVGRTMSQANLVRYAKDHGMTEAAARAKIEGDGIKIK